MAIKTIGFIGIGNMGRPMAANLVKGGYQVVAYDADPARAAQFAKDAGARSAAALGELGKSVDAIVTMLPTGKEVRRPMRTSRGAASPSSTRRCPAACRARPTARLRS
jgi:3-hydroxyisobutyrate dehydrogenase